MQEAAKGKSHPTYSQLQQRLVIPTTLLLRYDLVYRGNQTQGLGAADSGIGPWRTVLFVFSHVLCARSLARSSVVQSVLHSYVLLYGYPYDLRDDALSVCLQIFLRYGYSLLRICSAQASDDGEIGIVGHSPSYSRWE